MDVQVAESGPCRRTLTIKVSPEHIRGHLQRAYDAASRQVRMKGFRAGHVPRKVIEKKFGDAIRAEAKEKIINEVFNDAIRQHELKVVGRPTIEGIDNTPVDESTELAFTVHLDVRPEFTLKDIRGIEVDRQPSEVTDADVEAALKQLADQKKTLDPVEAPVEENDFVRADLVYHDEAGAEVLKREGAQLNANIPIAGTDPEAFRNELLGKEKGASLTIALTFPPNFDVEAVRGKPGSVVASLTEVKRVQPAPIDDELAKAFEFETLDALREELRRRIGDEKVRAERARQENTILDVIANDHQFELPTTMVEDQHKMLLEQFRERLKNAKLPEDDVEKRVEDAKEQAHQDAERRVRMFFLFDAIARQEQLGVTEADLRTEIEAIAERHGVSPQEVQAYYQEQKLFPDLQLGVLERKVREFLIANAKITDKDAQAS